MNRGFFSVERWSVSRYSCFSLGVKNGSLIDGLDRSDL